jgi:hypothetical protein
MNPAFRKQKGKLIQVMPSGATVTLLDNQPWAMLQTEKKVRIRQGVKEDTLKITNL